jgi:hypothetical protein
LITEWLYPAATHNTPAGSTTRMGFFMVLHLCYFGLLGGLVLLGIAALWSKITVKVDD